MADEEAELCWTRFRCFDPETGRWLTPDPLGVAGGANLAGYDGGPTVDVDPMGLATTGGGAVVHPPARSRREALAQAQEHAQVPRESKGGEPIPFDELHGTSRGKNAAELQRRGATNVGSRDPRSGAEVFDHPDGHPDLTGPEQPPHHESPHVHARNAAGEEIIIPYPGPDPE